MSNFLDNFKSEDGNSSILDTAEDLFSFAALFFPPAGMIATVIGAIDSIVDPDNKEDRLSNYDIMGILSAVSPSVANALNPERLAKAADVLGVADFALDKFYPDSKVAEVISNIHTVIDPSNKDERITNSDVLGIIAKAGLSKDNVISLETMKTLKEILAD